MVLSNKTCWKIGWNEVKRKCPLLWGECEFEHFVGLFCSLTVRVFICLCFIYFKNVFNLNTLGLLKHRYKTWFRTLRWGTGTLTKGSNNLMIRHINQKQLHLPVTKKYNWFFFCENIFLPVSDWEPAGEFAFISSSNVHLWSIPLRAVSLSKCSFDCTSRFGFLWASFS